MSTTFPLTGLLLAAGSSRRMGSFKPLLLYQKVPFVVNILAKMSTICQSIILVTGFRNQNVQEAVIRYFQSPAPDFWQQGGYSDKEWKSILPRIRFVHNPRYREGMFTSLQRGLREVTGQTFLLYHFIDQPHLPFAFYREFIRQIHPEADWIQPTYRGKRGHPILLHPRLIPSILHFPSNGTLQQFVAQSQLHRKFWECPYPQILEDVDTPGDYQNL